MHILVARCLPPSTTPGPRTGSPLAPCREDTLGAGREEDTPLAGRLDTWEGEMEYTLEGGKEATMEEGREDT